MQMLSKICPRCKKRAKKDLDGFSCITCGWTEYIINKTPKRVRGSVPYIDKHYLPYGGVDPEYRQAQTLLITFLYQTKKNLDRIAYFMDCPLDDCDKLTISKKSCEYSLRKRDEKYFRFLCNAKHLWYLVVLNGEPLYWLSCDLEVRMPKGIGTYGTKRGRPPKKKKMKNGKKY